MQPATGLTAAATSRRPWRVSACSSRHRSARSTATMHGRQSRRRRRRRRRRGRAWHHRRACGRRTWAFGLDQPVARPPAGRPTGRRRTDGGILRRASSSQRGRATVSSQQPYARSGSAQRGRKSRRALFLCSHGPAGRRARGIARRTVGVCLAVSLRAVCGEYAARGSPGVVKTEQSYAEALWLSSWPGCCPQPGRGHRRGSNTTTAGGAGACARNGTGQSRRFSRRRSL